MNWRDRAACRTEEPDLFFPIGTGRRSLDQLAEAKSVCRGCLVAGECLAWAVGTGQNSGVWGGMTEDERRRLRQSALPGTVSGGARVDFLVRRRAPPPAGVGSTPTRTEPPTR
jgi:WhiB family redox-sensing transcriptional regulator